MRCVLTPPLPNTPPSRWDGLIIDTKSGEEPAFRHPLCYPSNNKSPSGGGQGLSAYLENRGQRATCSCRTRNKMAQGRAPKDRLYLGGTSATIEVFSLPPARPGLACPGLAYRYSDLAVRERAPFRPVLVGNNTHCFPITRGYENRQRFSVFTALVLFVCSSSQRLEQRRTLPFDPCRSSHPCGAAGRDASYIHPSLSQTC